MLGQILVKNTLDVAGGGIAHTDGMGPAVPSSSALGRSGSTLGKLGALFGESSGSCVSEPMESACLQVFKLLLEAAVSTMALGATP